MVETREERAPLSPFELPAQVIVLCTTSHIYYLFVGALSSLENHTTLHFQSKTETHACHDHYNREYLYYQNHPSFCSFCLTLAGFWLYVSITIPFPSQIGRSEPILHAILNVRENFCWKVLG